MYWMRLILVVLAASLVYAKRLDKDDSGYNDRKTRFGICSQRPMYGNCSGHRKLWYYDVIGKICAQFIYSNCGGNQNRFYSMGECMNFCVG